MRLAALASLTLSVSCSLHEPPTREELRSSKPNIVVILADDMGYGDVSSFSRDSKIRTPHIDRLAAEGLSFTDAHSPGAWCVPSRYGLLTGRYPCRVGRFHHGERPVLSADQQTIQSTLRNAGYRTAMVGKWHLGFEGGAKTDGSEHRGGPLDRGFDRFFGIHASLDIPPYYFIDGRSPVAPATGSIAGSNSPGWTKIQGAFWREGGIAEGFEHKQVLPRFRDRAVQWIEELSDDEEPFFLYLALASPHTPWLPEGPGDPEAHPAGSYGAFVEGTDRAVGAVLDALEEAGCAEDTLIVFTSDNGPVWYPADVERFGHSSTAGFRGMKSDGYEGGHRMPFVVRWPGRVPAGTHTNQLTVFTDLLPTFAELAGRSATTPDGYSLVPTLLDPGATSGRDHAILKADASVIRQGRYKLIDHLGSGGFSKPRRVKATSPGPTGQLFDLSVDPGETNNLWSERFGLAEKMLALRDGIEAPALKEDAHRDRLRALEKRNAMSQR